MNCFNKLNRNFKTYQRRFYYDTFFVLGKRDNAMKKKSRKRARRLFKKDFYDGFEEFLEENKVKNGEKWHT